MGAVLAVVVAGAVLGGRVLWARSDTAPVASSRAAVPGLVRGTSTLAASASPTPTGAAGAGAAGPSAAGAQTASASGSPSAGVVVVHVVGRVHRAGLVRLPTGARVADAIRAAGGATRGADLSAVNLARLVVDGEQLRVPRPGEVVTGGPGNGGTSAGGGSPGGSAGSGGLVPINSADLAALDTLPGVGPVLAQRIIDWRTEHGRFTSIDELGEVSGIGDKVLAQIRPRVTL